MWVCFKSTIHRPTTHKPTIQSLCTKSSMVNKYLLWQWIKFPMTQQERTAARNKFANVCQPFSGAIGAIDCTYINLLAPRLREEVYVNHHGNHSLNVQAVSTTLFYIITIYIYVFNNS